MITSKPNNIANRIAHVLKELALALIIGLLFSFNAFSQNDSIRLNNGDYMVGEIKSFSKGILQIETDYSDEDFKIEFKKISELFIQRKCLIILTDGRRRFGNIKSVEESRITVTLEDGSIEEYALLEVVALKEVEDKFIERFTAYVDLSYNFTKTNNSNQFTASGKLNYTSENWLFKGSINTLITNQDNTDKIRRTDANLKFIRLLRKKLYLLGETPFLSNTEQALDARISPTIGVGRFLVSTSKLYLGFSVGFTWNIENYVDSSLNKDSSEGFMSVSLNLFDFEDFDLESDLKFYPSLSEKGRFRTDYNIDMKYDLPLDFYIKLGFTLNFDNEPAINGNDVDYVVNSGFGWEFD